MINIKNTDDDKCLKQPLVRYLNPEDDHPATIRKNLRESLILKTSNFLLKLEIFSQLRKEIVFASVFWLRE